MKKILLLFITAVTAFLFSSCTDSVPASTVNSAADLQGKIVGVIENTAAVYYAGSNNEIRLYATGEAMIADLRAGVLDCVVTDDAVTDGLIAGERRLRALDEPLISVDFRIATAKESRDLLDDINTALSELRADGTLTAISDHYLLGSPYDYVARADIPENAGTLRLAVAGSFSPYGKIDERGIITGFDVTVARLICDKLGVNLEIIETERADIVKNVWSSKADFGMGGIYKTEANESLVCLSDAYAACRLKIITRK